MEHVFRLVEETQLGFTNECWATPSIYADTRRWVNIVLAMVHRLRRWINAQPTLIKRLVSAGICMMMV